MLYFLLLACYRFKLLMTCSYWLIPIPRCICSLQYYGEYCQHRYKHCHQNPCTNDGKCNESPDGSFRYVPIGSHTILRQALTSTLIHTLTKSLNRTLSHNLHPNLKLCRDTVRIPFPLFKIPSNAGTDATDLLLDCNPYETTASLVRNFIIIV